MPPYPQIRSTEIAKTANRKYRPILSIRKVSLVTSGAATMATSSSTSKR